MIYKNVVVEVRGLPIVLSDNIKAIGMHGPISMSEKDIFTCIAGGAYVWEIHEDGSRQKLDFTNYNKVKEVESDSIHPVPMTAVSEDENTGNQQPQQKHNYASNKHNRNRNKK